MTWMGWKEFPLLHGRVKFQKWANPISITQVYIFTFLDSSSLPAYYSCLSCSNIKSLHALFRLYYCPSLFFEIMREGTTTDIMKVCVYLTRKDCWAVCITNHLTSELIYNSIRFSSSLFPYGRKLRD